MNTETINLLLPLATTIITAIVTYFLSRPKQKAEIENIEAETENKTADTEMQTIKSRAETDLQVSEAVINLYERLAVRLEYVEICFAEEKERHDVEVEKYRGEIELLREQKKVTEAQLATARMQLSAAQDLARRYRLIALDLQRQLQDEGLIPRHLIDDCEGDYENI